MGEDLKRANKLFEEFWGMLKVKLEKSDGEINKWDAYFIYLKGYSDATGQEVIA